MINDAIRTGGFAGLRIGLVTGCRNHPCAGLACPLYGVVSNTSCATGDQNCLPVNAAVCKYAAMCRHDGDTKAGPDVEICFGRQACCSRTVDSNVFGGSAEAAAKLSLVNPDALANPASGYAVADGLDYAGTIAVGYDRAVIE